MVVEDNMHPRGAQSERWASINLHDGDQPSRPLQGGYQERSMHASMPGKASGELTRRKSAMDVPSQPEELEPLISPSPMSFGASPEPMDDLMNSLNQIPSVRMKIAAGQQPGGGGLGGDSSWRRGRPSLAVLLPTPTLKSKRSTMPPNTPMKPSPRAEIADVAIPCPLGPFAVLDQEHQTLECSAFSPVHAAAESPSPNLATRTDRGGHIAVGAGGSVRPAPERFPSRPDRLSNGGQRRLLLPGGILWDAPQDLLDEEVSDDSVQQLSSSERGGPKSSRNSGTMLNNDNNDTCPAVLNLATHRYHENWSQQHGSSSPKRAYEQWSHREPSKSMRLEAPGMVACFDGSSTSGHGQGADTSPLAAWRSHRAAGRPVLHLGNREAKHGNPSVAVDSRLSPGSYFPSGAVSFSGQHQRSATVRDVLFHPAGLRTSFLETAAATQNPSRSTSLAGGGSRRHPSQDQDYFMSLGGSFHPHQQQQQQPATPVASMQHQWWQHPSGAPSADRPPSHQQQLQKMAFLHSVGDRWDAPSLGALLNSDSVPGGGTALC
jgi:hypothetical protein